MSAPFSELAADVTPVKETDESNPFSEITENLVQMIEDRGYVVPTDISLERMLLTTIPVFDHRTEKKKLRVLYYAVAKGSTIGVNVSNTIKENLDSVQHAENDSALVLLKDPVTPAFTKHISLLKQVYHIQVMFLYQLRYNPTRHQLVPKHELVPPENEEALLHELKTSKNSLPGIRLKDPIVRYYDWPLHGIVKIERLIYFIEVLAPKAIIYRVIRDI